VRVRDRHRRHRGSHTVAGGGEAGDTGRWHEERAVFLAHFLLDLRGDALPPLFRQRKETGTMWHWLLALLLFLFCFCFRIDP
jgi:hypothetical protein